MIHYNMNTQRLRFIFIRSKYNDNKNNNNNNSYDDLPLIIEGGKTS